MNTVTEQELLSAMNDSLRERDKELLQRLLRTESQVMQRIKEVSKRAYPDIAENHDYRLDTYCLIDAL